MEFRQWLPVGAANVSALEMEFNASVSSWMEQWMSEACSKTATFEPAKKIISSSDPSIFESICEGVLIAVSDRNRQYLAAEILGVDFAKLTPADEDQKIVQQIVKDCLSDLYSCICELFEAEIKQTKLEDREGSDEYLSVQIESQSGNKFCTIEISNDRLLDFTKRRLPQTSGVDGLIPRWSATEQTNVQAGGRIGKSSISLSEMTDLQVGDVLTLDRGLTDLLDMTINGNVVAREQLTVDQAPDGLRLTLSPEN